MVKTKVMTSKTKFSNNKKRAQARGPLALALKGNLMNAGAPELNSVDTSIGNGFFSSALTVQLINGVRPGTNFYERVGRKIAMRSVRLQALLVPTRANAAAVNNQNALVALVYDRQPTGSTPAAADIFSSTDASGTVITNANSFPNVNNRQRFYVLRTQYLYLPALGINGANPTNEYANSIDINAKDSQVRLEWFVNLKDLVTIYGGDTAGISSIATGALYFVTFSTGDTNATPAWSLSGFARLRYKD